MRIHFDLKQAMGSSDEMDSPCVHFVETGPSLLQEMPWLLRMDYKVCAHVCVCVCFEVYTNVY